MKRRRVQSMQTMVMAMVMRVAAAGSNLVPVIKRRRPASEVAMKDPHRIIPIRKEWIGSIEERPKYLELKASQKEKDERKE